MSVQQRLTEIDENWTKPFEQNCQLNKRHLKISSNWTIVISTVVTLNNLLIEQKRQLRTCQYWTNRSIEQLFFEQYPLEQLIIWTRPGDCCSNDICLVIPPWSKFPIVALLYIGVASYNGGQAPQTPLFKLLAVDSLRDMSQWKHKRHWRNLTDAMLAVGIQGGSVLLKKPVKNFFQDINMTVNNGLFLVRNLHQEWPFLPAAQRRLV